MHIHTDHLTGDDLHLALIDSGLHRRGVFLDTDRGGPNGYTAHRSRKRKHRFTFYLVATDGYGRRYANSGTKGAGTDKAATWHEWGAFIAELYHRDPDALIGHYGSARDFEANAVRPWQGDEARTIEEWRSMSYGKVHRMTATERLEYLRGEIRAERISWGEINELQGLADHIPAGDVELLEWAGVSAKPATNNTTRPATARITSRKE
jgi:hypothetical protein